MRNPFRTQNQALVADIACWTALVGLLVCVGVTANNPLWSGVMFTVAAILGSFAVVYNGSNLRIVVHSAINSRRYQREQAERDRRDASYGRDLRDLNRRHDRY